MAKDTVKKTANDGSRNSPIALASGMVSPDFPVGGVCGRNRLNTPSNTDRPAASNKGPLLAEAGTTTGVPSGPATVFLNKKSIKKPAAIQPMVPSTRRPGKSRVALGTWVKAIEFTKARVGL